MAESASVRANPSSPTTSRELVFTRLLDAPRELVFDAFTRPEHVKRPERLVFKHIPGKEPVSHETTIDFADRGGRTEVTMRLLFTTAASREMAVETYRVDEGGRQTLGRLAEFLARQ